jgi:hypothetical protein
VVQAPADDTSELELYLGDRRFRRETLLASLTSKTNHYAKRRIASYALERGGWDALPQWTPKIHPLRPGAEKPGSWTPIWDGRRPSTQAEWVALGRRVFFYYPLRAEPPAEFLVEHPELAGELGMDVSETGEWTGLVAFLDDRSEARVGITCALCHSQRVGDQLVVGQARRGFDYGKMRLAWYAAEHRPLDSELARRMGEWGPGRADITDDLQEDPVAIPDLWGIAELDYLTAAGTLRQVNTSALAIRQETQILFANGQRTRPPRELAWALAQFVRSIEAPPPSRSSGASRRGGELFETHCRGCHFGPTGSGSLVDASFVGTEPALAEGPARGTGRYRPAPLLRLTLSSPFLHDGSVSQLDDLLDPARLDADYLGGARGPGPVPGHEFGMELAPDDKGALLDYLRTL